MRRGVTDAAFAESLRSRRDLPEGSTADRTSEGRLTRGAAVVRGINVGRFIVSFFDEIDPSIEW